MVKKLEIFEKIGFNIKKYRVEQNISLKELSNKTGINIKYLSRIEKAKATCCPWQYKEENKQNKVLSAYEWNEFSPHGSGRVFSFSWGTRSFSFLIEKEKKKNGYKEK